MLQLPKNGKKKGLGVFMARVVPLHAENGKWKFCPSVSLDVSKLQANYSWLSIEVRSLSGLQQGCRQRSYQMKKLNNLKILSIFVHKKSFCSCSIAGFFSQKLQQDGWSKTRNKFWLKARPPLQIKEEPGRNFGKISNNFWKVFWRSSLIAAWNIGPFNQIYKR